MFQVSHRKGEWNGLDWYLLWQGENAGPIIYAPNLGIALAVGEKVRQKIVNHAQLPNVVAEHFSKREAKKRFPLVERPKAFHLAIGLTRNCTLYCDYCHAEADKDIRTDPRLIDSAIEHAFKSAGETPRHILSVSFAVGGEPTMNWPAFVNTIDKLRNLEGRQYCGVKRVYISMTTNCYYGRNKREYVARNLDKLTLSLDGDRDVQDKHRPTRSGKGSYRLISETVRYYLGSKEIDAALRATVSDYSVNKLSDIVGAFFAEFGGGYTVAFEPLVAAGRGQVGFFGPPRNADFATSFWAAREYGKSLGIRVITSAANLNRLVGRYCGAMSIPSFTLCSNGAITACHRDQEGDDYGYGSIEPETGVISTDNRRIENNIQQTDLKEYCNSCPVKWHCAGDCPDLRKVGYDRCDINLYLLYKQLQERLASDLPQCCYH